MELLRLVFLGQRTKNSKKTAQFPERLLKVI